MYSLRSKLKGMLVWIIFIKLTLIAANDKCDVEIKELDSYQLGLNLNLSHSKSSKRYVLLPHHNIFAIHPSTGVLQTVQIIDRESLCQSNHNCNCLKQKCRLELTIFATDLTKSNQPPTRIVKTICIHDINDNKPLFPETTQTLELTENSPVGTKLELHSAHDRDSPEFAIIKYSLNCAINVFNLSYVIEKDHQYRLDHQVQIIVTHNISFRFDPIQCTLTACDIESCSSMRIVVKINDINDNSPEWSSPSYHIKIKENIAIDTIIHTFQATDLDTDFGRISYSIGKMMLHNIAKTYSSNLFTIDSITGDLRVNGNIDYEDRLNRRFILTITAKDNGIPALSSLTTATIDIEDVNDNKPVINFNRIIIDVEENSNLDYLDYFTVFDYDDEANGKIECEITEPNDFFKLKRSNTESPITYEIYLTKALDHEKHSMLILLVQCQDGGKPNLIAQKRITINVIDVNDNSVYFPQKTVYLSIAENIPIGTEIVKLSTVDLDKKSDVTFSLINANKCGFVNIDSNMGYLTTNEIFDREVKDEYVFQVQVTEKENANFTDTAKIIIRVQDVNDNTPVFREHYSLSIPENMTLNGYIGLIQAVDPDLGENGTIMYSQADHMLSSPVHFAVSNNGEIRLCYKLDFVKQNIHQLIVMARDHGRPIPLSSSTTVLITVLDSNNNPPKFEQVTFSLTLTCQTQIIDKNLFPVTDRDKSPENTLMNYQIEIISPILYKQLFKIDVKTGTITMTIQKDQCDFRQRDKEKIEIKLSVYDPSKPEFRDSANLCLHLENERYQKNINDNNNAQNQGLNDGSLNKNNRGPQPEFETSVKQEELIDQNIAIIMVLIFVTIFLGIFLISIVCLVKRKRQPEDNLQDMDDNMIMEREKGNASIHSSKSDYNDHPVSYNMSVNKMISHPMGCPTMTTSLRNKGSKPDVNSCQSSMQSVENQMDKAAIQYEMTKLRDNNAYQSLTMNSKFSDLDENLSLMHSFQSSQNTIFPNKNLNVIQNLALINRPNNHTSVSVSFV